MGSHSYVPKKLELELKNRRPLLTTASTEELPVLELKKLPDHLWDVLLGESNILPVIVAVNLV